jgi:hypothetical protein
MAPADRRFGLRRPTVVSVRAGRVLGRHATMATTEEDA